MGEATQAFSSGICPNDACPVSAFLATTNSTKREHANNDCHLSRIQPIIVEGRYPNSNDAPVLEDALKDHSTIIWFPLCWQACLVGAVDRFDEGTAEAPASLISDVRGMFRRPSQGYVIAPRKIESF